MLPLPHKFYFPVRGLKLMLKSISVAISAIHHTISPVILLLLTSTRCTQGRQHNSSGSTPLNALFDRSILTTCRCEEDVESQVALELLLVRMDSAVTAMSEPLLLLVLLVVELLHCRPYHTDDDDDDVSSHGFVMVIQLVLSFHDDFPLVDRNSTFKLYFSRKYDVVWYAANSYFGTLFVSVLLLSSVTTMTLSFTSWTNNANTCPWIVVVSKNVPVPGQGLIELYT